MSVAVDIRECRIEDRVGVAALYRAVFPEEDLVPLVGALLDRPEDVLSLVSVEGEVIVGHIAFTKCGIEDAATPVALLGPLAVRPGRQRQGLGGALVRDGVERLTEAGVAALFVLGDSGWYGRHGFFREDAVTPPYVLVPEWRDAWQSRRLGATATTLRGRLEVPEPWRRPALWAP